MDRAEDRSAKGIVSWITEERDYYLEKARQEKFQHGGRWYTNDVATARFFNRMLLLTKRGINATEGRKPWPEHTTTT